MDEEKKIEELSYQEMILLMTHNLTSEILSDCFAISRIENSILHLSRFSPFNPSVAIEHNLKLEDLERILKKYGIETKK